MIADPLVARVSNLLTNGVLVGADADVNFDLISNGPGSQTLRKANSSTYGILSGVIATCRVSHDVTAKGRRRSTIRFDASAPVPSPIFGSTNTVPHSASAYLVIDQLDAGSEGDKALVDVVISALLQSLVQSRDLGDSLTLGSVATDLLNGEP